MDDDKSTVGHGPQTAEEIHARYSRHPDHALARVPGEALLAARQAVYAAIECGDVVTDMPDEVADAVVVKFLLALRATIRVNLPTIARLRAAAADTSPHWSAAATVYPPSAGALVALIDVVGYGRQPSGGSVADRAAPALSAREDTDDAREQET